MDNNTVNNNTIKVECSSSGSAGQQRGGQQQQQQQQQQQLQQQQILSETSGLSQPTKLTSSCSTSLEEFTPVFTATNAATPNCCAYCKTTTTNGCWRRGWTVKDELSANLCNRCGLRYKANKLDGHEFDPTQVKPRKRNSSKNLSENNNNNNLPRRNTAQRGLKRQRPPNTNPPNEELENDCDFTYTAYCKQLVQFDENQFKLFYVKDVNHKFRLLVAGIQIENGKFIFKTVSQTESPGLSFSNEEEVIQWLRNQGATTLIQNQRNYSKLPSFSQDYLLQLFEKVNSDSSEIVVQRTPPIYVRYEEKYYVQEGKQFKAFYLIDENGRKHLAVNGAHGLIQAFPFLAMDQFGARRFRNEQEVRYFLQQIINTKQQISPFQMEEQMVQNEGSIQEIFQTYQDSPELLHWVMKQPNEQDIREVRSLLLPLLQLRGLGKSVITADEKLVLDVIDRLDSVDMNLKLLEYTGLAGAVNALKYHQHESVRNSATILCEKWRNTTFAALQRANQVLRQQFGAQLHPQRNFVI